ncbi:MAG TPA: 3-phosphoshikimate 1-carboxyvinyltransferase [Acidimicrobiales bacterium]
MSQPRHVDPVPGPVDATVVVPGSKSVANRALVCALLAEGASVLEDVPDGDDTDAMVDAVSVLGRSVVRDGDVVAIEGSGSRPRTAGAVIDARQAGTVGRFLAGVLAIGDGPATLDADPQLRERPMGPLFDVLRTLGATVEPAAGAGAPRPEHLPVVITPPDVIAGGRVELPGHVSSQFLTALMLVAPLTVAGLEITLTSPLVSRPYAELTARVMAAFGVEVEVGDAMVVVPPGTYADARFAIEPDASSASYFWALGAVSGGRCSVADLTRDAWQGDVAVLDVFERMGATVVESGVSTAVEGPPVGDLRAVDVDLSDISDTAPTVAAVAAVASGTSRLRGIGFIRGKESDRIGAVVDLLAAAGVEAREHEDGLDIVGRAGRAAGGRVAVHDDHRLAMSAAVLGAASVDGVTVDRPECVAKTFPTFWKLWDRVTRTARLPGV